MAAHIMHDTNSDTRTLQRHMRVLLAEARRNEDKYQRLQSLELLLLGANNLSELIRMVIMQYPQDFELDAISLVLDDPHHEIRTILEDEGVELNKYPQLKFNEHSNVIENDLFTSHLPELGPYKTNLHSKLFSNHNKSLNSIARMPLVRQGRIIGCLNLGSHDDKRYITGTGTELLQRLSAIITICLENTLNLERLKRTGLTDSLTSLNNRRFFDQRIIEEIERSRRNNQPLSCLFIDIDFFKKINDQYGHPVGDKVLQQIAKLLDAHMRRSDVLARFGGEEFAILLSNTATESAEETAERLRNAVEVNKMLASNETDLNLTISIGVATAYPAHSVLNIEQQSERLLKSADEALFDAKRQGRNKVCFAQQVTSSES